MNDSVEFTVKGRTYTINFPTVGEYYRIECLKQSLSNDNYGGLIVARTISSIKALDMIDIEATLSVLAPQLISDLKTESLSKLGLQDFNEIKKAYKEKVLPFMKKVNDLLNQE
jgi:hypothetical protein